ncbi:MAG TPA: HAD family phosphatase [Ruminiclostridium sp.]
MKYKGIIFDFNGTLFWDTELHIKAWRFYSEKLRGYPMSDGEMKHKVFGRTNSSIVEYLLGKGSSKEIIDSMVQEKEKIYRDMVDADLENVSLAPGAESFLDFVVKNNIAHTIATGSERVNVNYFIEIFKLGKWFDPSKIVIDDGFLPGKPEPDIYLKAAQVIGVTPKECVVFEDSLSGIESARRADIGKIIAIGPKDTHGDLASLAGVGAVIHSFDEIDRSVFYCGGI